MTEGSLIEFKTVKLLVVIPTYNENENITAIIPEILKERPLAHVLVVDDNSPDGTGILVAEMGKVDSRIHLLPRPEKQGLGRAYIAGFQWGMSRDYDVFLEMDLTSGTYYVSIIKQ